MSLDIIRKNLSSNINSYSSLLCQYLTMLLETDCYFSLLPSLSTFELDKSPPWPANTFVKVLLLFSLAQCMRSAIGGALSGGNPEIFSDAVQFLNHHKGHIHCG